MAYGKKYQRWTPELVERLRSMWGVMTVREIATRLSLTVQSVREAARRYKLNHHYTANREWTPEELEILRKGRREGLTAVKISALLPGRSRSSVLGQFARQDCAKRKLDTRSARSAARARRLAGPQAVTLPRFSWDVT
jgi:hypothetical protein